MEFNLLVILFPLDSIVKFINLSPKIFSDLSDLKLYPNNGSLNGGTVVKIQGSGLFNSKNKKCKLILPNDVKYMVYHL